MFFQFLSTIKVNLVAKIMQSACLWVIFHVKHKKLPFLTVLTLFLILVNSKMPTIVGDVTGLQQSHHPLNIPHLVKKIKGFPLKVKAFQSTATYQKLRGGVPSTPSWYCFTSDMMYKRYKRLVYASLDLLAKNSARFVFQEFVFQA